MGFLSNTVHYIFNPEELRAIVQWKVWHNPVHERNEEKECASLRKCFYYLDMTSRSFSAVIKELNPELLVPICLFYLVLRGLDTIEDDMTIPLLKKEPLLRDFANILDKEGWNFDGNGPNEKDRELLVNFQYVIEEYKKIKPEYQVIIKDITQQMGDGMAENAISAENETNAINTVKEYEMYCHYVAGLVGEGLTRLFVEGGYANPALLKREDLYESMGQFLQQTNIIRDIKEDLDDKRRFWPKAVWSKYVDSFEDLFKKENEERALQCSSEMVLLSLERATDSMFYLAGIKEQSVFNFAAIPQSMAIATLELCFQNPNIFQRNVKITKGQACQMMVESSQNLEILYEAFRKYARKIHKKNNPKDPNFLRISIACAKIEQFIENIFPSQDPKAIVRAAPGGEAPVDSAELAREKAAENESKWENIFMVASIVGMGVLVTGIMMFVAWMCGARFDLIYEDIKAGIHQKPAAQRLRENLASATAHNEL